MDLLIAPISGHNFIVQAYSCIKLLENIRFKPTTCICSSGGCVISLLGTMSNWDPSIIRESLTKLNSHTLFGLESSKLAKFLQIIYKGYVYDINSIDEIIRAQFGVYDFSVYDTEILVGTVDIIHRVPLIFTNKNSDNSFVSNFTGYSPVVYYDGDFVTYCKAIQGSMAIPFYIKPVSIVKENHEYLCIDGGVYGSTSLNIINDGLSEKLRNINDGVHIVYLRPVHKATVPLSHTSIVDMVRDVLAMTLSFSQEKEELTLVNMFNNKFKNIIYLNGILNESKIKLMNESKNYLLFITAVVNKKHDLTLDNFNSKHVCDFEDKIDLYVCDLYCSSD